MDASVKEYDYGADDDDDDDDILIVMTLRRY